MPGGGFPGNAGGTELGEVLGDAAEHLGDGDVNDGLEFGPSVLPGEEHREADELEVEPD